MTSFGTSDMFTRLMWGIVSAMFLICIRSVCLGHGMGMARTIGKERVSPAAHTSVAKGRVLPHHLFTSSRVETRITNQHNTFASHRTPLHVFLGSLLLCTDVLLSACNNGF
jgi:hypothetical protein